MAAGTSDILSRPAKDLFALDVQSLSLTSYDQLRSLTALLSTRLGLMTEVPTEGSSDSCHSLSAGPTENCRVAWGEQQEGAPALGGDGKCATVSADRAVEMVTGRDVMGLRGGSEITVVSARDVDAVIDGNAIEISSTLGPPLLAHRLAFLEKFLDGVSHGGQLYTDCTINSDGVRKWSIKHVVALPHDILHHIASFLKVSDGVLNMRLVCKDWCEALTESGVRFWGNIMVTPAVDTFPSQAYTMMKAVLNGRFASRVYNYTGRTVHGTGPEASGDDEMDLLTLCPNLHSLTLRHDGHGQFSGDAWEVVGGRIRMLFSPPNLQANLPSGVLHPCRNLECISMPNSSLTDRAMVHLSACQGTLKKACLSGCTRITDVGLKELAKCGRLEVLDISKCRSITDRGIGHLSDCRSLKELNIEGCYKVSDVGLESLSSCVSLEELYIEASRPYSLNRDVDEVLSDKGLAHLVKCDRLHTLSLQWCAAVTDDGLAALSQCKNLTSLNLYNSAGSVTDQGVCILAEGCAELKLLNMSGCVNLTDMGVSRLAACCSRLVSLNLSFCPLLGDIGVQAIATCTNLESLSFSDCEVTDSALESFRLLTRLTNLHISKCKHITDRGIGCLADMVALKTLRLLWLQHVTANGLAVLASCRTLRTLTLLGCSQLTDYGLVHLTKLTQLQSLNLSYSTQLSEGAVNQLCRAMPQVDIECKKAM